MYLSNFLMVDSLTIFFIIDIMKFNNCKFCLDAIEIHHIRLHESSCPLNPINLEKICEYLKRGIVDTRLLKRASFYQWAITQKILTSITIANRFNLEWSQALYQLLIYGYLAGYLDFVYTEILLSIISYGDMWLEENEFKQAYATEREKDFEQNGIKTYLYYNYYLLLMHILHRCNKDILLEHGALDENKEVVDVQDAIIFLSNFAPELLNSRLKLNLLGQDAITFVQDLTQLDKERTEQEQL